MNIAIIDGLSSLATIVALVIVVFSRRNAFTNDIKYIFLALLVITSVYNISLFLKWSEISTNIAIFEDSAGMLIPLWWIFFLYALQKLIFTVDKNQKEYELKKEVSERFQAEEKAKNYNIQLSTVVNNFGAGLLMETPERKIEFANQQFCELFNIPAHPWQLTGVDCRLSAKEASTAFTEREAFIERIEEIISAGIQVNYEQLETEDGRCLERDYVPVYNHGQLINHLWVYRDVTKRITTEREIKNAAQEWRTTFDSISDMIAIVDREWNIKRANKAFAAAFNKKPSEIIGSYCYRLIHGEHGTPDNCPKPKAMETGKPETLEFYEPNMTMNLEITASPIINQQEGPSGAVLIIRNVTQRKLMQQQLILQDRMAHIGELASGIAHEINNPLTGIIGFSELLQDVDLPQDALNEVKYINKEARRTADIVKNLSIFARGHVDEKTHSNINDIINRVIGLHSHSLNKKGINVITRLDNEIPPVEVNGPQLHQVFSNIIANAEQSIHETGKEGEIIVATEVKTDNNIIIKIIDNGKGIAETDLDKIFNPFFTTKDVGEGIGLGLSICYGIITEHGGKISAKNNPGGGVVVTIELPSAQEMV